MSSQTGDCDLLCQQAAIILNGEQVVADANTVCEIMNGEAIKKFLPLEAAHVSSEMKKAHQIFVGIQQFIANKVGPFNR